MEKFEIGATAGFLGFLGGLLGHLFKHLIPSKTKATIEQQPFDVRLAQEFVTRKEYLEVIDKLFEIVRQQQKDFSDIRAGFSQQLGSIEGTLKVILETMRKEVRK